jgi:heat shock protein HtpX
MAAFGLYTHIESNRRRSIALLIGLFFLVYVLVYAGALIGEAMGGDASLQFLLRAAFRDLLYAAPFATMGTALWVLIGYKFHQAMIDAVTGGREVTRQEQPRLYDLLENLCISRGIPMPKLKVIESDALNAFATGLNEKQYSITVTSGLLKRLDDAEVEAVLGHELTHIRNGDVRMLVIAVVIAGVISFFAELLFRGFFNSGVGFRRDRRSSSSSDSDRGKGGGGAAIVIAVALVAVAYLLSLVIRFALARSREFLADAGSVELTKNPNGMITALRKIEGRGELESANSAIMEMCVDNPRSGFADIFATHPAVDKRIAALVQYAGGQDPGPIALPAIGDETVSDQARGEQTERRGGEPEQLRTGPWGTSETEQTKSPRPWGTGAGEQVPNAAAQTGAADPPTNRFLPEKPPVELGTPRRRPWGRER